MTPITEECLRAEVNINEAVNGPYNYTGLIKTKEPKTGGMTEIWVFLNKKNNRNYDFFLSINWFINVTNIVPLSFPRVVQLGSRLTLWTGAGHSESSPLMSTGFSFVQDQNGHRASPWSCSTFFLCFSPRLALSHSVVIWGHPASTHCTHSGQLETGDASPPPSSYWPGITSPLMHLNVQGQPTHQPLITSSHQYTSAFFNPYATVSERERKVPPPERFP